MATAEKHEDVKEYAGGWITERKGTDAPIFLKISYVVVVLGCLAYAIVYMNGEVGHATRGALVQQFNQATGTANGFMYFVAGLTAVFAVLLWKFAFAKPHDE